MNQRHYLLKGTVLLTLTGMLAKFAGFYYKIFLSRTIAAEEIGVFQMTMPVFMLCMSVAAGGIQTAISRFTAEYNARNQKKEARLVLLCGAFLSVMLALAGAALLWLFAPKIASRFLLEPRCTLPLRIISVSLPFSSIHACIAGYFMGKKIVHIPAISQMTEQLLRIGAVLLFYFLFQTNGRQMDAAIMALGQIAGELAAAVYCMLALLLHSEDDTETKLAGSIQKSLQFTCKKILNLAIPISLTRVLLSLLQSMEAALLPRHLQAFGLSSSKALSVYGTLTGMTMPLIMFPTAATNALSALLLPMVSEAQALNQNKKIAGTIRASFYGSLVPGYFFMTIFLLLGSQAGEYLFHSSLAGQYLCRLALICPFLYLNITLNSILHGLGQTAVVSLCNLCGICLRLVLIHFMVPVSGMDGYMAASLAAQAGITFWLLAALHRKTGISFDLSATVVRPGLACLLGGIPVYFLNHQGHILPDLPLVRLLAGGAIFTLLFLIFGYLLLPSQRLRQQIKLQLASHAADRL